MLKNQTKTHEHTRTQANIYTKTKTDTLKMYMQYTKLRITLIWYHVFVCCVSDSWSARAVKFYRSRHEQFIVVLIFMLLIQCVCHGEDWFYLCVSVIIELIVSQSACLFRNRSTSFRSGTWRVTPASRRANRILKLLKYSTVLYYYYFKIKRRRLTLIKKILKVLMST